MKTETRTGLLESGVPSQKELENSPGYPGADALAKGPIVVIECVQDIPCDPCESSCPTGAVVVGTPITNLPVFFAEKCDACGTCIPICPGQAIFRVDQTYSDKEATVSFPYEFLPMPGKGDVVKGVDRAGEVVCEAKVLRVQQPKSFDHTAVITVAVPKGLAMVVRSIAKTTEVP